MIEVDEQQLEIFRLRGQVYDLAAALRTIECLEENGVDGDDFESLVVQAQTIARAALAKCNDSALAKNV